MRVRIDAHHAAQIERAAVPAPVEVKSPWVRVDLDRHMVLGASAIENFLYVDLVAGTPEKLSPRHVTEDRHERISNCAQYALGLFLLVLPELPMDAGHDEVKAAEDIIRIVQRAVRENVGLNSLENAEFPAVLRVQSVGLGLLFRNLLNREPPGIMG